MFKKILIANRGEIALRIIRACKEMGIETVAVYSEADRESSHVHLADESVCIGPAPSADSYLNVTRIISAAEISDAEAIHPGYGFLAENTDFAELCSSCDIVFIGPSPQAISRMGDKAKARETMMAAGVPIIPGSEGVVTRTEDALALAHKIGYPVIVKASGGGGGKGMRVAHTDMTLGSVIMTAQQEAQRAFGNAEVYIEKYIEQSRHVEIQIMGDSHGNAVHLGERDCSIQRRHQKVLEESPSTAVNEQLRAKMGEVAVRAAKEVNYCGAGTVEFLLDADGSFYFMEMNTRIQVEHPVTELVTGYDLIKEQIRVAAGEPLSFRQEDVKLQGWAIECRINAENVERNFMPSPGRIVRSVFPGGPGIRVDSHIYSGYCIPPNYDSMIAKLITYGRDREEAIVRMRRALDEFVIEGVHTTIELQQFILSNTDFVLGNVHTKWLEGLLKASEV